jgi:hypothetical protein
MPNATGASLALGYVWMSTPMLGLRQPFAFGAPSMFQRSAIP